MRLASSLADVGSVLLIALFRRLQRLHPLKVLLVALSPVSIMVSGFHVNTDPVMVFLLLFSMFLTEMGTRSWAAGIVFGLALSVKVVPAIFVPAFLLYLPCTRQRIEFVLSAGSVFVVGSTPYVWQNPLLVVSRTFGYTPHGEYWGLTQMIYLFLPPVCHRIYAVAGKLLVFLIVLLVVMNRRNPKVNLFLQCGCISSLFLFWTPGFGYQYLTWLVPWSAGIIERAVPFYYAASTAFLFAVYTVWSRGLPWYFANSLDRHVPLHWVLLLVVLGATCWISIGAMAYRLWRELVPTSPAPSSAPRPACPRWSHRGTSRGR
jgi:hypothetical protein